MKTAEQIISFIEGWKFSISTNDPTMDEDNPVYYVLDQVLRYANK